MSGRPDPAPSKPGGMGPLRLGRVVRSIAWNTSSTAFARVAQLVIGIVVAHILSKHDFGVFAVVLVVFTIVISISELGISTALVRERDDVDGLAPTAVTLSLLTSAILAGGMWALSPFLAHLVGSPEAATPIALMSIVVLLAGPSAVPSALLTRDFQQGRRFAADMSFLVLSSVVLITLSVAGFGVYAFVWSRVAGQVISVILLIALSPKFYWPGFHWKRAKYLLRFGLPMTASSLVNNFVTSVDVVIIGRTLGPVQLGVYNLANNVSNWPPSIFSGIFDSVALPIFARVHDDLKLLQEYLANAVKVSTGLFFYVTAMCVSLAQPLVDSIYGPKWVSAGPVLSWFAIYGSVEVLISLFVVIVIASNAPRSALIGQLVWFFALIPAMILGVFWGGLVGGAIANVVVVALVVLPLTMLQMRRASRVALRPLLVGMLKPFGAAVIAGVAAHLVSFWSPSSWGDLFAGGIVGTIVYALLLVRWGPRVIAETRVLYARDDSSETAGQRVSDQQENGLKEASEGRGIDRVADKTRAIDEVTGI
jgi:lipopolysaccharide exporter